MFWLVIETNASLWHHKKQPVISLHLASFAKYKMIRKCHMDWRTNCRFVCDTCNLCHCIICKLWIMIFSSTEDRTIWKCNRHWRTNSRFSLWNIRQTHSCYCLEKERWWWIQDWGCKSGFSIRGFMMELHHLNCLFRH